MSLDNVQALPPNTRLGDYRLDAVIGHGGFGITYRAFDTQLAKFVAIKEYLPVEFAVRQATGEVVPRARRIAEDYAWGLERFLEEARALARFRHPHIVPVLRYFAANGTAYTVMEFEDGRSLADLLADGRRLAPESVLALSDGLLSGLAAVHAQGFLHRDIKPSNIIVRRDGVPVLIDFGAARQAIGGRTRTLTGILTPQYAPIEQYAFDEKQGPWSDIYSAAAVLHHAIAGHPPPEATARIGTDPYRPLAVTQADRFELAFLAAIDRALSFTARDRPQSVEEWRAGMGLAPPAPAEQVTQRMAAAAPVTETLAAPRGALGGVSREQALVPPVQTPRQRLRRRVLVSLLVVSVVAAAGWRYRDDIRARLIPASPSAPVIEAAAPTPPATTPPATTPPAVTSPTVAPTSVPVPPPLPDDSPRKAFLEKAERAASEAKAVLELAEEAAVRGRAMAGEARIAAARAARPDLEKADRLSYADGASYIGQNAEGKRQGFGVAALKDGERQAGEWTDDKLDGLGTVRFADDVRHAGQWREGQSAGHGVREKPGVERLEGNFTQGQLDGPGIRRTLGDPMVVQAGTFKAGVLDGSGVESVGDKERYAGSFRAGQRHGFGQLIAADGTAKPGRWEDGKLLESAP